MIENISSDIVSILIRYQTIDISEISVYQYGFEVLISSFLTCLIALVSGLILKCVSASITYFIIFAILSTICGGFHSKTYLSCNLIFTIVTLSVLIMFKFLPLEHFSELHYIFLLFSVLITYYYAPVENENKPLTMRQKKTFRIIGTSMVLMLAIVSCVLNIKFRSSYCILIDSTLYVVAFSMFVTDPRKGEKQNE